MKNEIFEKVPVSFLLMVSVLSVALPSGGLVTLLICIAVHEAGHFIAAMLLGARDIHLRPGILGFEINYAPLSLGFRQQAAAALAGPAAGILLSVVCRQCGGGEMANFTASCSMALSVINVLPLSILDGGSAGKALIQLMLDAESAERISLSTDIVTMMLLVAASIISAVSNGDWKYIVLPFCLTISYCANERNVLY